MSIAKTNPNVRYSYLDCIKGLSILCITFLHFEKGVMPSWLNSWIGLFMITTFYFTAGWVFGLKGKIDEPKVLFKKRIKQLGIPYLWFTAVILCFEIIWWALGMMESETILRDIYKTITLRGIGTLWFLPVLFFGEYLFCRILSSKRPILVGSIIFILMIVVSYLYYEIWLNRYLDKGVIYQLVDSPVRPFVSALCAWPIIGAGYLVCRKFAQRLHDGNLWISAILGTFLILISIWFLINPPFQVFYVNGFVSNTLPVIGFIGVFALLSDTFVGKFFSYWGRNSLILMCTHFSITMEILMGFDSAVLHQESFEGISTIIYFVIAILLTYPIVMLFNGPLSFMLGKKK